MVDIDDILGNLRDYFSSQPYQQMMKNITEISNRLMIFVMILFAPAPNQQELFFCLSSIFHPASFYLSFLQTRDIIQEIGKLVDISNTASTQQPVVQSFINLGIIIKSSELLKFKTYFGI